MFPFAKLNFANLKGVHLAAVDLTKANLKGANLSSADLTGAVLREANLAGAIVKRANLRGADLSSANLNGAAFSGADLTDSVLARASMQNAALRGAVVTSADFRDAHLYRGAKIGPGRKRAKIRAATFLDLATCEGLETARFTDPNFVLNYVDEAFRYALSPNIREASWSNFMANVTQRISVLRQLYSSGPPSSELVSVVDEISVQLLKYLRIHPEALHEIKPRQFERLVAEILAGFGWEVQLTPATKDGGYDIFAISKDLRAGVRSSWLIECKRYREENKVGIEFARALYGVKTDLRVANAMLATTSHFTKAVEEFKASRYDFELRDYEGILEWLNTYRPSPDGTLYVKDNHLEVRR